MVGGTPHFRGVWRNLLDLPPIWNGKDRRKTVQSNRAVFRHSLRMSKHMPEKDNEFWARFLPEINKIIEGTLASEAKREEVLASLLETPPQTLAMQWDALRSRIEGLARCPDDSIAAADVPLKEAEGAYRDKLEAIETLRLKLADWAGRSIE